MNKLKQGERNALKLLNNDGAYIQEGHWLRTNAELRHEQDGVLKTIREYTLKNLIDKGLVRQGNTECVWVITESGREAANKGYYE